MRFIKDPNPPIAALPALRIVLVVSVGPLRYQVDCFATLRVLITVVEVIISKPASQEEVD